MKCHQFYKILLDQLRDLKSDYYFLHEQYWALPGDKSNIVSKKDDRVIRKYKLSIIYKKLIEREYINIYKKKDDEYILYVDHKRKLECLDIWELEESVKSCLFVSSGNKYDKLVKFLSNKVHSQ